MRQIQIKINPLLADNEEEIKIHIANRLGLPTKKISAFQIIKQSIDARKRPVVMQLLVNVFLEKEVFEDAFEFEPKWQNVSQKKPIHIAGSGPAGLFAALQCILKGHKPIVLERGKDVQKRRRDLAMMNKKGIVNPESNYCFGEGGAGTYSDGKLYTRSGKRGDILRCLQWFHYFGAEKDILYKAHPHIGTNKLPHIIANMRKKIIECGGEVRFDTKLTDINIQSGQIRRIELNNKETEPCQHLILATGHSARDIFSILAKHQIVLESKLFALGVRIEHPQDLINEIQYKCSANDPILNILGAASYSLVSQENNKGVFSFCMCPGGIIAPASTEEGALVVNGWSPSKRNGRFANSGMVVTVNEKDFNKYGFQGTMAALEYQNSIEEKAWQYGGGKLRAPAQRLTDFLQNKYSSYLPESSYLPGLTSALLHEILPQEVHCALVRGLLTFSTKLKGFLTSEAIVTATESRTSSPIKIPRSESNLENPQVRGLYPCGEGAGYAGGIISAAMDGIKVAQVIK